tara:strand:- start:6173 stop:6487 length:315 start_codon:yes stop_codon:yes gene_type:complete
MYEWWTINEENGNFENISLKQQTNTVQFTNELGNQQLAELCDTISNTLVKKLQTRKRTAKKKKRYQLNLVKFIAIYCISVSIFNVIIQIYMLNQIFKFSIYCFQ